MPELLTWHIYTHMAIYRSTCRSSFGTNCQMYNKVAA